ncbi:MAG: sulfotransferase domain-containing protein [Planctomycetota bacterium]|nr:sulfotransferase domain-containing protein [Planctomycetota bacterium]
MQPDPQQKTLRFQMRRTRRWIEWKGRRATSHLRVLPDFLIIGAMKGGTTSLYDYLCRHEKVEVAFRKEVHYFDGNYTRGTPWYRGNFPTHRRMQQLGEGAVTGEATPYYLYHQAAAERIAGVVPQARLIAVLRDPADRAISHYFHSVRTGMDTRPIRQAFAEENQYVQAEEQRVLRDDYTSDQHRMWSYVSRGHYAQQLEAYFQRFSREQMLILKSEEFFTEPQQSVNQVTGFLGLSPVMLDDLEVLNAGTYAKSDPPEVAAVREELQDYFRPHNQRLSELLNRDFIWAS